MSSIGSSPAVGSGQHIETSPVRAVPAVNPQQAAVSSGTAVTGNPVAQASSAAASPTMVSTAVTSTLGGGAAPVDNDRVSTIRKAIQNGAYPVIPTRIGDAMIAAGVLLRTAS